MYGLLDPVNVTLPARSLFVETPMSGCCLGSCLPFEMYDLLGPVNITISARSL
jgi:hypothetical protein